MQTMRIGVAEHDSAVTMPDAGTEVLPGLPWGRFDALGTPAYWRGQTLQYERSGRYASTRLGADLIEEVAACLLGGYGMPAEVGLAAFRRLRDGRLLDARAGRSTLEDALAAPLDVGGRMRPLPCFPRQKAAYLAGCLARLERYAAPADDVALRGDLMGMPGIGPKTASWIVRNHRRSDRVAILDVHVVRAGVVLGLFPPDASPARDYLGLEATFLGFAAAIGVAAGPLDSIMWHHMRLVGSAAARCRRRSGSAAGPVATPTAAAHAEASRPKTASDAASPPFRPSGQKASRKAVA